MAGIRVGTWKARLPPERELALTLQISRPTLRSALSALERQGKLEKGGRLGRKIIARNKANRDPQQRNIGVLILYRTEEMIITSSIALHLLKIQQDLHNAGYEMDIHFQQARPSGGTSRKITELVKRNPSACWLLVGAAAHIQKWFRDAKIPAAIVGSTEKELGMPAFDIDYRAVCRHAGQLLWRRGHRRIALIAPVSNLIGDTMSEEGFLEGLAQMECPNVQAQILRHDTSVESIKRTLDKAMAQAQPPTALLMTRARAVLTALGHLQACGYRIPKDISILSRDHEDFFSNAVPAPTHYVIDWQAYGSQIAKCLLRLAETRELTLQGKLVLPPLNEGETVAPPAIGK